MLPYNDNDWDDLSHGGDEAWWEEADQWWDEADYDQSWDTYPEGEED